MSAVRTASLHDLARAEENWRLTFDNSPIGMAIVSPDGLFLHVNLALCDLTGYPADQLRRLTFADITHRDDLAVDVGLVEDCLAGRRTSYRLSKRYVHAAGFEVPVQISVALVRDRDGDPLHFVVHIEDITDRVRWQLETERLVEQLAQRQSALQRSNDDLAHFASRASHDLRTPLTAIVGYLELLHESGVEEPSRGLLDRARASAERMETLLARMLDHARVDCSSLVSEEVDLPAIVEVLVSEIGEPLNSESVAVTTTGHLDADPSLVHQVLGNLVGNAVKYREPTRSLRIEVTLDQTPHGSLLSVADNGVGISPDLLERVFEMYFHASAGDPEPNEPHPVSHGIGLATCRRIMEHHGGRIWAEQLPQGGTAVRCLFPTSR